MNKRYLVTGGSGFLGSALVKRLAATGAHVRVFDNNARGNFARFGDLANSLEFVEGDIRDPGTVANAIKGVDVVCHLAFINGTEFFYTMPELVLDVGVRGMMNVVDGCRKHGVRELVVASSSEVYHHPPTIPTDETAPLCIPDPLNPRYSYAAGKLISEIIAINYGRSEFDRVLIFRPHNVYGPEMGWEHVIPQFVLRMKEACKDPADPVRFPIQDDGTQTRAFVYVDDFIDGLMVMMDKGEHLGIYHIGTMEEISMAALAGMVGAYFGRPISVVPGPAPAGGTSRRCPDIQKLAALGYAPKISLEEGLRRTARWYDQHASDQPAKSNRQDSRWKLTTV